MSSPVVSRPGTRSGPSSPPKTPLTGKRTGSREGAKTPKTKSVLDAFGYEHKRTRPVDEPVRGTSRGGRRPGSKPILEELPSHLPRSEIYEASQYPDIADKNARPKTRSAKERATSATASSANKAGKKKAKSKTAAVEKKAEPPKSEAEQKLDKSVEVIREMHLKSVQNDKKARIYRKQQLEAEKQRHTVMKKYSEKLKELKSQQSDIGALRQKTFMLEKEKHDQSALMHRMESEMKELLARLKYVEGSGDMKRRSPTISPVASPIRWGHSPERNTPAKRDRGDRGRDSRNASPKRSPMKRKAVILASEAGASPNRLRPLNPSSPPRGRGRSPPGAAPDAVYVSYVPPTKQQQTSILRRVDEIIANKLEEQGDSYVERVATELDNQLTEKRKSYEYLAQQLENQLLEREKQYNDVFIKLQESALLGRQELMLLEKQIKEKNSQLGNKVSQPTRANPSAAEASDSAGGGGGGGTLEAPVPVYAGQPEASGTAYPDPYGSSGGQAPPGYGSAPAGYPYPPYGYGYPAYGYPYGAYGYGDTNGGQYGQPQYSTPQGSFEGYNSQYMDENAPAGWNQPPAAPKDSSQADKFSEKERNQVIISLFSKVRHNRVDEVGEIFDMGIPVDVQDENGNTPLHIACQNGRTKIVRLCVERKGNLNAQNDSGQTPLHFCAAYGYHKLGGYLIAEGANTTIRNKSGLTPFEGIDEDHPVTISERTVKKKQPPKKAANATVR